MRVLVTRPSEDAGRTGEALAAAGHEAILAPLFAVVALDHDAPADCDALVATSANALRHARLEPRLRDRPLYAVGRATAGEARRAGFKDVRSAEGDSADLAAMIAADPGRRLLYLAGRPRRDAALTALAGFKIATVETYETVPVEALPPIAAAALASDDVEAVLHFSPRASSVFADLVGRAGLMPQAARLLHIFISPAAALDAFTRRRIAQRPNLAAMIAALDALDSASNGPNFA